MASDQQFCLRWNNHQSTLISVFDTLLENEKLVDCTLAADGQFLKAHKVVLSACSPYLEAMLSQHFDQHPILILKDVKYQELKAMLDYMYRGEVNISEEQLGHFLKAAESLQIKGLSDRGGGGSGGGGGENGNDQTKRHESRKPPTHVPHLPNPRTVVPHPGHGLEQKKPHINNPHDLVRPNQSKSPMMQDDCGSPTSRKRRRPNRPSSTDSNVYSTTATHYSESFSEGNSSDAPSANVPTVNITPSNATISKAPPDNEPDSYLGLTGVSKPVIKTEVPHTLVQPKTEYVDYENEDSVEDATLDGDDDDEANLSRPGPSFASSSPGMAPWQLSADGSNDDLFLAAQEGAGANQNSQDGDEDYEWRSKLNVEVVIKEEFSSQSENCTQEVDKSCETLPYKYPEHLLTTLASVRPIAEIVQTQVDESLNSRYVCTACGRSYKHQFHLKAHRRECSQEPMFECPECTRRFYHSRNLSRHLQNVHKKPQNSPQKARRRSSKKET